MTTIPPFFSLRNTGRQGGAPLDDGDHTKSAAKEQLHHEVKKARIKQGLAFAHVNIEHLWSEMLSAGFPHPSTGETRLSYAAYRKLALTMLRAKLGFPKATPRTSREGGQDGEEGEDEMTADLTSEQKERLEKCYFDHPILSPHSYLTQAEKEKAAAKQQMEERRALIPALPGALSKKVVGEKNKNKEDEDDVLPAAHISLTSTFKFMAKKNILIDLRGRLEECNTTGKPGYLSSDDLQAFLSTLLPHLTLVRDMPPGLIPYYLCHASQRFCFLLELYGRDELSIDRIMESEGFEQLLLLYEPNPDDAIVPFPVGAVVEYDPANAKGEDGGGRESSNAASGTMCEGLILEVVEGDGSKATDLYRLCSRPAPKAPKAAALPTEGDADIDTPEKDIVDGTSPKENSENSPDGADDETPPRKIEKVELTEDNEFDTDAPVETFIIPRECLYYSASSLQAFDPSFVADHLGNWYSLPRMANYFNHFCELDQDMDGVLNKAELTHFNEDALTEMTVERVLECYARSHEGNEVIDYRGFINLILGFDCPNTKAGSKYLWKLLDVDGTGTVSGTILRVFGKQVSAKIMVEEQLDIKAESLVGELVDLIDPRRSNQQPPGDKENLPGGRTSSNLRSTCGVGATLDAQITFKDVVQSGMAAVVLPSFLDHKAFARYEKREAVS